MGLFSGLKHAVKSVTGGIGDVFGNVFDGVGGFLNNVTGVSDTAKMSYKNSVALANQQQRNNIELWNMQNAYNTPTAQIARMADAGIDINPMTYAVGNGNMSSTAQNISPATYHAPSYGSPGNPIEMVMSVMSGVKDMKRQDLQNKLLQKDIDNYEHNHASPYRDAITALADIFGFNTNKPTNPRKNPKPSKAHIEFMKSGVKEAYKNPFAGGFGNPLGPIMFLRNKK